VLLMENSEGAGRKKDERFALLFAKDDILIM
jgi:hypothetical protein